MNCSQCGKPTEVFREGVCEDCYLGNQQTLDEHNARFDWWGRLTDDQRAEQIHRACQ